MPFTQEKMNNLKKCWGCPENCKLGFVKTKLANPLGVQTTIFIPTIAGKEISEYLDENGLTRQCDSRRVEDAMILVRKIASLCDNYNTKTK